MAELIVALDVDTLKKAKGLVETLCPLVKIFKVGYALFILGGLDIIDFIHQQGAEVFLDLKFFDIPNTVANAVKAAVRLKAKMLTLHIQAGTEALRQAVAARDELVSKEGLPRTLLLGVSILTSKPAQPDEVLPLVKEGLDTGLDGIVCSAQELHYLRDNLAQKFIAVTPGIRPYLGMADDQRRVATVKEAILAGSDYLVVGRPIVAAEDPYLAARRIQEEIQGETKSRY